MASVHLVLGGARSGKSRHALAAGSRLQGPHIFIATAQAYDSEMTERIQKHREERDGHWRTVESPIGLAHTIASLDGGTILIDCCTLWLSNVMLAERDISSETAALIDSIASATSNVVLVSNEVGSGIVPETKLGRDFRDEQGRLNQRLAEIADTVELVVAGIPLRLKG